MIIEKWLNKDNATFSAREISLLTGLNPNAVWKFLKRLEKYGTVKPQTAKISNNGKVVFWKILDKDEFLVELERRLT